MSHCFRCIGTLYTLSIVARESRRSNSDAYAAPPGLPLVNLLLSISLGWSGFVTGPSVHVHGFTLHAGVGTLARGGLDWG
jgi:hypothetical protein